MKDLQYIRQAQYKKGFIVPLVLGIIAVLAVGGGMYVYKKKSETPILPTNTEVQGTNQVQQQTNTKISLVNTQTNNLNSQSNTSNWKTYTYTGSDLPAISFKYPNDWKLDLGYYTTPGGAKYVTGIILTAPNGIDQISYSEGLQGQITCASLLNNKELPGKIKCETIKSTPFFLTYNSDTSASVSIYNQILTTIK